MNDKPVVGGVSPRGYQDIYEVRILICYLLHILKQPLTQEQIFDIIEQNRLTNYFTFAAAVSELISSKQVVIQKRNEDEYLILQQLGKDTVALLGYSLPRAVRDRIVTSGMTLLTKLKRDQENKADIKPHQGGYQVRLTIHDSDQVDLLTVTLFVPDQMQADVVKQRFLQDPVSFYKNIISYLTEQQSN